jgi:hypothetical protein
MSLWINLKESFAQTADRMTSPHPVMDLRGLNPYAPSKLFRLATAPELIVPAVGVTFASAATSLIFDSEMGLRVLKEGLSGVLTYNALHFSNLIFFTRFNQSKLFLDKTHPQAKPLAKDTELLLKKWHSFHSEKFLEALMLSSVGAGVTYFTPIPLFLSACFGTMAFQAVSDKWRTHRALSGAWTTLDKLPPKQEEKAPAPLGAQGAMPFTPVS